jgi:hypothetical protein
MWAIVIKMTDAAHSAWDIALLRNKFPGDIILSPRQNTEIADVFAFLKERLNSA